MSKMKSSTSKSQSDSSPEKILRIGTWNCRSLSKFEDVMLYCKKSECDIIALQETKNNNEEKSIDVDDNYMLHILPCQYESSCEKSESKCVGLAFLVNQTSVRNFKHVTVRSDVAYCKFKINDVEVMLINVYAPAFSEYKCVTRSREFYSFLGEQYSDLSREFSGPIIIAGDLNATVQFGFDGSLKPHIMSNVYNRRTKNNHCDILHSFLVSNNLYHLNSRFEKVQEKKWTCQHMNKTSSSEIDGFLSERTDIVKDIDVFQQTRKSDHIMVISEWRISKRLDTEYRCFKNNKFSMNKIPAALNNYATVDLYADFFGIILGRGSDEMDELTKKMTQVNIKAKAVVQAPLIPQAPLITEEEVRREIDILDLRSPSGPDEVDALKLKRGGKTLVKALEKLFNDVLTKNEVPSQWTTTSMKTLSQTETVPTFGKKVKCPSLIACIYSSILARRLSTHLNDYTRDTRWHFRDCSEDMKLHKQKQTENAFVITSLIEKHSVTKECVYFAFVELTSPTSSVKQSSILESLKTARAPEYLFSSFAKLLENGTGIHLGNVASNVLFSVVLQSICNQSNHNC